MTEQEIRKHLFKKTGTDLTLFENVDILTAQAPASAEQLLLQAVFEKYPLVIFTNLTRDSFYMMAYDNFSRTSCPSTGIFSELIIHGAASMHEDDRDIFSRSFR